jgi:hypothetical protein
MDEERCTSILKWKRLPIPMDEVKRHSSQNRIKLYQHHHLVIQEMVCFYKSSNHAVVKGNVV